MRCGVSGPRGSKVYTQYVFKTHAGGSHDKPKLSVIVIGRSLTPIPRWDCRSTLVDGAFFIPSSSILWYYPIHLRLNARTTTSLPQCYDAPTSLQVTIFNPRDSTRASRYQLPRPPSSRMAGSLSTRSC